MGLCGTRFSQYHDKSLMVKVASSMWNGPEQVSLDLGKTLEDSWGNQENVKHEDWTGIAGMEK